MMKDLITTVISIMTASFSLFGQTDAYIKLHDTHGMHPRIVSITFPGDANTLDMYNSIYGHGAVLENPWLAFRIYMDNRQSIDLYVKQTPRLELDKTGFYTTPEQIQEGYGCDVLWAGKSIAAGSFRGWHGNNPVTIGSVRTRTQTVVSDNTVEIRDSAWMFNGHPVDMIQRYKVNADSRDLEVEISLKGFSDEDLFCTGIQKLESENRGFIHPSGSAASWGSNIPDKNLPEMTEDVGLAIFVKPENIVKSLEDDLNYLFIVKPDKNGKIKYRVSACGSREISGYKSAEEWFGHIRDMSNSSLDLQAMDMPEHCR